MYDLARFTQDDMQRCAVKLRNMDENSQSMEETASRIVRYLYENLIDRRTGNKACALVRFFKTHPYGDLSEDLQEAAQTILKGRSVLPSTKCLTLLATAGDEPYWNRRQASTGHQAIPLIDQEFVNQAPMISQLIRQFGLDVSTVIESSPAIITKAAHKAFNVFYIAEAIGSPYIPAQEEFVLPYQVQSVLGFGGMLPSGNLFAVIVFSKVPIPLKTANLFRWISAYVRIAAASFDRRTVFIQNSQRSPQGLQRMR